MCDRTYYGDGNEKQKKEENIVDCWQVLLTEFPVHDTIWFIKIMTMANIEIDSYVNKFNQLSKSE